MLFIGSVTMGFLGTVVTRLPGKINSCQDDFVTCVWLLYSFSFVLVD